MVALSVGPFLLALLIVVVEMTEVVALVFALRGEDGSVRPGVYGAVGGTAVVVAISLGTGVLLLQLPTEYLLAGAGIALFAFGLFLFRSTLRTYRRARAGPAAGKAPAGKEERAVQFAGGFTVGAVESIEAVIVLLSLTAAGQGASAVLGAVVGGALLVGAAAVLHERVRRIKIPQLKLVATSLLFTFAAFWTGEAFRVAWPYGDLALLPLFAISLLTVAGLLGWWAGPPRPPVQTNG